MLSSGGTLLAPHNSHSNSNSNFAQKYHLSEEHSSSASSVGGSSSEGTVSSTLTIINLDSEDDHANLVYVCWAENRAGSRAKNFTVTVLPSSSSLLGGTASNWSRVELAGGIVGILISLVLAFVLVTLILIRSKRFGSALSSAKKFGGGGDGSGGGNGSSEMSEKSKTIAAAAVSQFLKGGTLNGFVYGGGGGQNSQATNYGYQTSSASATSIAPHHLSMLGLDGIDKKPEIFGYSTSRRSPGVQQPDLVANGGGNGPNSILGPAGYELNTYSNGGKFLFTFFNLFVLVLTFFFFYFLGMPSYQPSPYHYQQQQQPHHAHQSSDASMMLMTTNPGAAPESYDMMYPQEMYHSQQEADGLYRAVMVQAPPPPHQGPMIIGNQHFQPSDSPQLQQQQQLQLSTLSAGNLYSQYALSQHDLRLLAAAEQQQQQQQNFHHQQQQSHHQQHRISPADSFTNLQSAAAAQGRPNAAHLMHISSKSPFPDHQNQAYILANQNISSVDLLYDDDDVFAPPTVSASNSNSTANYSPVYEGGHHPHYQQQYPHHQQQQMIYGQTTTSSSKRSSPWSTATVIPNHHLQGGGGFNQSQQQPLHSSHHHLMVTPTPNLMSTTSTTIRYSPDEGYGEEGGSSTTVTTNGSGGGLNVLPTVGQLEGTEV